MAENYFNEFKDFTTDTKHNRRKSAIGKMALTLADLESAFVYEQKTRRNSEYTIKHYQQTFRVFYEFLANTYFPHFSKGKSGADFANEIPIKVLEREYLQKNFGDYLEDVRGVSEQTVLTYYRDYRAILYYAMDEGWIEPFEITVKDKEPPIKNTYTDSEIKRLIRKPTTDAFEENRNWVLVNYFLDTGNRIQTVLNLKVKDIDFEEGYININTQKSGRTSRLGLTKKLSRILAEYIRDYRCDEDGEPDYDEYLFCNRFGEKLSDGGIKKAIAEYNLSRGVSKTSIHLFRHTFARLWITSGGDIVSLKQALGHSSLKMVQRYANLYASDVKDKMEMYSALSQQRTSSGSTIKKRKAIQKRK